MAEPLQKTDDYGNPKGDPFTIQQAVERQVASILAVPRQRGGSYPDRSVLGDVIKETTERIIAQEFKGEIDAVKAELRGRVRASAADLLADAVGKALGS